MMTQMDLRQKNLCIDCSMTKNDHEEHHAENKSATATLRNCRPDLCVPRTESNALIDTGTGEGFGLGP